MWLSGRKFRLAYTALVYSKLELYKCAVLFCVQCVLARSLPWVFLPTRRAAKSRSGFFRKKFMYIL